MRITSERLILKEISLSDLQFIHKLYRRPEIDEFNTLGIPENIEVTRKMMVDILEDQKNVVRSEYEWCIYLKEEDEPVGNCGLHIHPTRFRKGEVFYNIYPEYWREGFATEALVALLKFCFDELKFHRVEAGVAIGNLRSINLLEKVGFQREGQHRSILPIRGDWKDNFTYAILENEFDSGGLSDG